MELISVQDRLIILVERLRCEVSFDVLEEEMDLTLEIDNV